MTDNLELLSTVRSARRRLAEVGPTRARSEGDFERVALPDHDADVLRDLLVAEGVRVVVEIGLAYDSSALAIGEALLTVGNPDPKSRHHRCVLVTGACSAAARPGREGGRELGTPLSNRLVADDEASLGEQVLHVTEAEVEPK